MNKAQEAGIIQLHDIKEGKGGVILGKVVIDGVICDEKTLFPPSWAPHKIMTEVQAASQNILGEPLISDNGLAVVVGEAPSGIKVFFAVNQKTGAVQTFYPIFEQ